MTIAELVAQLQSLPQHHLVLVWDEGDVGPVEANEMEVESYGIVISYNHTLAFAHKELGCTTPAE